MNGALQLVSSNLESLSRLCGCLLRFVRFPINKNESESMFSDIFYIKCYTNSSYMILGAKTNINILTKLAEAPFDICLFLVFYSVDSYRTKL